jgi:hypothetical protein
VENSGTAIGIRGKDGVVFAVEKIVGSKLYEKGANRYRNNQCCGSGIRCRFAPHDSGWVKKSESNPVIRILEEQPGSYFRELGNNFLG